MGLVAKTYLPNYGEFCEQRWFSPSGGFDGVDHNVTLCGQEVNLSCNGIFACTGKENLVIGVEICEDLWVFRPPSAALAQAGATIILNLSASSETVGKAAYRRSLVTSQSGRLVCGYVYADAGEGESTTDLVFAGHNLIAENGALLSERRFATGLTISEIDVDKLVAERRRSESTTDLVFAGHNLIAENGALLSERRFATGLTISEIDVDKLVAERRRTNSYTSSEKEPGIWRISFDMDLTKTRLTRHVSPTPFVPEDPESRQIRCSEILCITALGLKQRLEHTGAKTAVVGLSGGLDSTLAVLITALAMQMLDRPTTDIIAVTMPCFGTTDRTKSNAVLLAEQLGATLRTVDISQSVRSHFKDIGHDPEDHSVTYENAQARERTQVLMDMLGATLRTVDISQSVRSHFKDIGHDPEDHSVTYENAQARERTQVLMDIANQSGGIVIGTGDLSELALGWCTYNGDHMSNYAVNAGIPKTLVRHLVSFISDDKEAEDPKLSGVLEDILDTPVSPELLPAVQGEISQKTEDLVGPYELHDFFLYYLLRWGFSPKKIYRLAAYAFGGRYSREVLLKWLKTCYRRFFSQQFKRSCLPDGPKVGTVGLSPRGDWRMPSDAKWSLWQAELEELEND